jgi:4-hydroxybenzoate polyprenyltransferase
MHFYDTLKEYAKLSSAHFIILTAIIPVTGAIAMGQKDLFILTIISIIGILTHIYGFALNHYIDIDTDRHSKDLTERPLTTGRITKPHARIYILAAFLAGLALTLIFFTPTIALIYLIGISLATIYDIYSKRIPAMDLILASAVTTSFIYGATTVSLTLPPSITIFAILAFIQTLNFNLIAGSIKDADHDQKTGSHNLATRLGLHTTPTQTLHVPTTFKTIAYTLAILYTLTSITAILTHTIPLPLTTIPILLTINLTFILITHKMLTPTTFNRHRIRALTILHVTINWLTIPILLTSVAPLSILLIFYPPIGLITTNAILYHTILRPNVL